jgi:hypothetical protein
MARLSVGIKPGVSAQRVTGAHFSEFGPAGCIAVNEFSAAAAPSAQARSDRGLHPSHDQCVAVITTVTTTHRAAA